MRPVLIYFKPIFLFKHKNSSSKSEEIYIQFKLLRLCIILFLQRHYILFSIYSWNEFLRVLHIHSCHSMSTWHRSHFNYIIWYQVRCLTFCVTDGFGCSWILMVTLHFFIKMVWAGCAGSQLNLENKPQLLNKIHPYL